MVSTNSAVQIIRYADRARDAGLLAGIDRVFFESSNTQSFASEDARQAFRERWLGRYLVHDPEFAYVALARDQTVAGYLVASLDDPARTARFSDVPYFPHFANLTASLPRTSARQPWDAVPQPRRRRRTDQVLSGRCERRWSARRSRCDEPGRAQCRLLQPERL